MSTINITHQIELSDNFKLRSADMLISKLRMQLGQEKTYIIELEETLKKLEKEVQKLKTSLENEKAKVKKVQDKYSADVQETVKLDSVYQHQRDIIKKQEEEINSLQRRCDTYITELVKLRDERNN